MRCIVDYSNDLMGLISEYPGATDNIRVQWIDGKPCCEFMGQYIVLDYVNYSPNK